MFFRRIKEWLGSKKEPALLAFEVAHFLIDVVIVVHIFVR